MKTAAFLFVAFILGTVTGGALVKLNVPNPGASSAEELVTGLGGESRGIISLHLLFYINDSDLQIGQDIIKFHDFFIKYRKIS